MGVIIRMTLAATLLISSSLAEAGCPWSDQATEAFKPTRYQTQAEAMTVDLMTSKVLEQHKKLSECLSPDQFLIYFSSASMILARYGRNHCHWPPAGPGAAPRAEYMTRGRSMGMEGMKAQIEDKFRILGDCLDRTEMEHLYVDFCLTQAEMALDNP